MTPATSSTAGPQTLATPAPGRHWPWALLLAALVVAGRAVYVSLFAESVPFWDQWGAEGLRLLKPWVEGRLTADALLAAHNEHRILLTRLIALALFEANHGQWDNLVSAYANTVVYATVPLTLYLVLAGGLARPLHRGLLFVLLLALAWLPYAWENTRIGFQNQFYLMSLLAILALWLAARARGAAQAGAAALAAAVGLFTMASGILAPVAAGGVLSLRAWTRRLPPWRMALALLPLVLLAAGGFAAIPHIEKHDVYKAQDLGQWAGHFFSNLGWPLSSRRWAWLLVWLPTALAAWRCLRLRQASRHQAFALGLAAWALLQVAAISYSRGHLSSRYLDTVAMGVVANAWLALNLLEQCRRAQASRAVAALALLGAAASVAGLAQGLPAGLAASYAMRELSDQQVRNVRAYVNTGDMAHLEGKPPQAIPYPGPERLAQALDDPTIRAILPPSIAPALEPATASIEGEVELRRDEQGLRISTCAPGEGCEAARGRWSSQPLRATRPYLYWPLDVRGQPAGLGVEVQAQGRAPVGLGLAGARGPRQVLAVAPGTPVRASLVDASAAGALALRGPVEAGRLSRWAMRLQDGVRLLFGHPTSDALQRQRIVLTSPVASGQRKALPLYPNQLAQFEWNVPRGGRLAAVGVLLGNYGNSSDGKLALQACVRDQCQSTQAALRHSRDNQYFELALRQPLQLESGQRLVLKLWTHQSSQPLAFWLDAPVPGAARIRHYGPRPRQELAGRSPALVLVYQD